MKPRISVTKLHPDPRLDGRTSAGKIIEQYVEFVNCTQKNRSIIAQENLIKVYFGLEIEEHVGLTGEHGRCA